MKARTRLLLIAAAVASMGNAGLARAAEDCEGRAGAGAAKLTIETSGLHAARGEVAVTVYPDNRLRFLAPHGKLLRSRVAAARPVTRACFWLPPGVYAVAVYHDENGDHDFARDQLGRPAEGFGFSNDAPARMGLPAFQAVRFRLPSGGRSLSVRMRYP